MTVNKRRLWLLVSVVWIAAVVGYHWRKVWEGYQDSFVAQRFADERDRDTRYEVCTYQNHIEQKTLWDAFGKDCKAQNKDNCADRFQCDQLVTECVQTSDRVCGGILMTHVETFQAELRRSERDRLVLYLKGDLSNPLKVALAEICAGLLLFWRLPRLLAWLTSR